MTEIKTRTVGAKTPEFTGFLLLCCLILLNANADESKDDPWSISYSIINRHKHETSHFTQGLLINDAGDIFESSGKYGQSFIAKYRLDKPDTKQTIRVPEHFFLEGITVLENILLAGTWKERSIFRIDPENFRVIDVIDFPGEIWGMTTFKQQLVVSDGGEHLRFYEARTLKLLQTIRVTCQGLPVHNLNELETLDTYLLANVWHSNKVLVIDPETGDVKAALDLSRLASKQKTKARDSEAVLNGIAWNKNSRSLLVTGKYWDTLYELEIETPGSGGSTEAGHKTGVCPHAEK